MRLLLTLRGAPREQPASVLFDREPKSLDYRTRGRHKIGEKVVASPAPGGDDMPIQPPRHTPKPSQASHLSGEAGKRQTESATPSRPSGGMPKTDSLEKPVVSKAPELAEFLAQNDRSRKQDSAQSAFIVDAKNIKSDLGKGDWASLQTHMKEAKEHLAGSAPNLPVTAERLSSHVELAAKLDRESDKAAVRQVANTLLPNTGMDPMAAGGQVNGPG